MSLFGLAEKKRIAVLENQVAAQQQIIDQMLKLTERSITAYAEAHNIANEALAIAKTLSEKSNDDEQAIKNRRICACYKEVVFYLVK